MILHRSLLTEQKSHSIHAPALRAGKVKSQSSDKVGVRVCRGSMLRDALISSTDWTMLQPCLSPSWLALTELHSEFKLSNIAPLKKDKTPPDP